jgi:hypothetical protein
MNEKQLPIVTFEQAKILKALGFNYMVAESYNAFSETLQNTNPYCRDFNSKVSTVQGHEVISAPTVALALKWLRGEKGMIFLINVRIDPKVYSGVWLAESGFFETTDRYEDYESAESALLDELLTILENE